MSGYGHFFLLEVLLSLELDGFDQLYISSLPLSTLTLSSALQSINSATSEKNPMEKILQSQDSNPFRLDGKLLYYPLCYPRNFAMVRVTQFSY